MNDSKPTQSQNAKTLFGAANYARLCLFAASIVALTIFSPGQVQADVQANLVREHASELECAAEEMRDEIKAHFKGTRMYGRLLGTNAQIKAKAAAIERRVKRDPCYRSMQRDLKKLNELTCELTSRFDEALVKHARCEGRPIQGDTRHVAAQIVNMVEIAECMTAASKGHVIVGYAPVAPVPNSRFRPTFPQQDFRPRNYGSEFEPYNPNHDVAPGVLRVPRSNGHSVMSRR